MDKNKQVRTAVEKAAAILKGSAYIIGADEDSESLSGVWITIQIDEEAEPKLHVEKVYSLS